MAKLIRVKGKVQGVGFRPFVYKIAKKNNLCGYVLNDSQGVQILIQGSHKDIQSFEKELYENPPEISQITEIKKQIVPYSPHITSFEIKKSKDSSSHDVLISPDIAICDLCTKELFDPDDRRHLYPFINCTNCGPRFTITKKIPYDRKNTSMACFEMCDSCMTEYNDPLNRRFHAQPNCCSKCGPRVYLLNKKGEAIAQGVNSIEYAAKEIIEGNIVALKGLGGFHICCMADDRDTILKLRKLKNRPNKPFALMASSLEDVKKIVHVEDEHIAMLTGNIKPIVVIREKSGILPREIAPDTRDIGIMLPYTPMHQVLFYFLKKSLPKNRLPILIMTSGNLSSHPIAIGNREAISSLKDYVDYFLIHNRDILIRCDDSVVTILNKKRLLFYRRGRGYVPSPIFLRQKYPQCLGVGAELKNTICIIKEDKAFVSQYIGDLKNLETYNFFIDTITHFKEILRIEPEAIGCDLHPDYMSTRYAKEQTGKTLFQIQHHHAHILSVMAENKISEDVIGISLDGTGLGDDNTIWGGEILIVYKDLTYNRIGHLYPIKLPGMESAIKDIWKIAVSLLYSAGIMDIDKYLPKIPVKKKETVLTMLEKNINCIDTTSCGRLFDGISAILGIKTKITYEGEGAIALENIQANHIDLWYPTEVIKKSNKYILDTVSLINKISKDIDKGIHKSIISKKFHLWLCNALAKISKKISKETGIKIIALSGGVFQNKTISIYLEQLLKKNGLIPRFNRELSPNDENISLGQAFFVSQKLRK
ncbi:carbamoyltransferase HypF [Desulfothermus okinawensis]